MHSSWKCTNKNEGNIELNCPCREKDWILCRQKDMQRQLEKITDLVRLIVQKMEIRTEIETDDTHQTGKNENFLKMQKIRQTLHVARRFTRTRGSSIPTLFDHSDKI